MGRGRCGRPCRLGVGGLGRRFVATVEQPARRQDGAEEQGLLAPDGLHAEQSLQDIRLDAVHHGGKHVEPFALVLDRRVFLPVARAGRCRRGDGPCPADDLSNGDRSPAGSIFPGTASARSPVPALCARRLRGLPLDILSQRIPTDILEVLGYAAVGLVMSRANWPCSASPRPL